jgi:hypothetical protein
VKYITRSWILLLIWAAPLVCAGAFVSIWYFEDAIKKFGITIPADAQALLLIFGGLTWILRIGYRYRGKFQESTVGILQGMHVSLIRPRAVRLKGILGRGESGPFWSPDLLLRDASGMVLILCKQSTAFVHFVFGTSEAKDYIDKEVVVEGWFRQGEAPYVELSKISDDYGNGHRAYSRWVKLAVAVAVIEIGLIWFLYIYKSIPFPKDL